MTMFPGGRWLLCWPDDYDVRYQINPWMDIRRAPHKGRAVEQWIGLHHTLIRLGAWVEYIQQGTNLPDMVFTANGGLVVGKQVVLPSFRYKERQGEEPLFSDWFRQHGYSVTTLTTGSFEGEGDALFIGSMLVGGYGFRTDRAVYQEIGKILNVPISDVELVDSRFYHLDTCYCPLRSDLAMAFKPAFTPQGFAALESLSDVVQVPEHDAIKFVCNSVVLGNKLVMPAGCPDTAKLLEKRGFEVFPVELDEFIKAGGAAKCLSLRL